jgi:hypothetical protein
MRWIVTADGRLLVRCANWAAVVSNPGNPPWLIPILFRLLRIRPCPLDVKLVALWCGVDCSDTRDRHYRWDH